MEEAERIVWKASHTVARDWHNCLHAYRRLYLQKGFAVVINFRRNVDHIALGAVLTIYALLVTLLLVLFWPFILLLVSAMDKIWPEEGTHSRDGDSRLHDG